MDCSIRWIFIDPGSIFFLPPYMKLVRSKATDSTLKALEDQVHSIHVLECLELGSRDFLDFLKVIDSQPSGSLMLTSLELRSMFWTPLHKSGETIASISGTEDAVFGSISSILTKHRLICFSLHSGESVEKTALDHFSEIVQSNREDWAHRSQHPDNHQQFTYQFGLQFRSSNKGKTRLVASGRSAPFRIEGEYMLLDKKAGEIFAMIYIPSHGMIIPTLSLKVIRVSLKITAKLRNFEGTVVHKRTCVRQLEDRAGAWEGEWESVELDMSTDGPLPPGCYELRVTADKQFYLKDLTCTFQPTTEEAEREEIEREELEGEEEQPMVEAAGASESDPSDLDSFSDSDSGSEIEEREME
ncbi:hypothetical protein L218DRAFT_1055709 [Marasmius fiardii PR-910]|nr:hypothetical protein L218DRAFT_1055709 [Marasmius fiardii PR-910]